MRGAHRTSARLVVLALACACLAPVARADGPSALDRVLARLAKIEAFSARFREEKALSLLVAPLVSEGTIYYARPDRLARRTAKPSAALFVIDGGALRVEDATGKREMRVESHPVLAALIETLMDVLAGDRAALEARATLRELPRGGEAFGFRVVPKAPALRKVIREMIFEGTGETLEKMTLTDGNGDVSTTVFSHVKTRAPFSASEWAALSRDGG